MGVGLRGVSPQFMKLCFCNVVSINSSSTALGALGPAQQLLSIALQNHPWHESLMATSLHLSNAYIVQMNKIFLLPLCVSPAVKLKQAEITSQDH